jgi:membrane protein implicated in regulation of membrane protease activity
MDVWMIAAIAMLVVWAVGTFAFAGPGWIHLLLTVGLSVLIWRLVTRRVPDERSPRERR